MAMNPGTARRGPRKIGSSDKGGARCHLEIARVGSSAYLVLVGEFDLSFTKRFKEALAKAVADETDHLVIDLRSVTFIDSTGLALLLKADALAREGGFHLHV